MTVAASPTTFGPYEIETQLGRGAIGTVYAARDKRIGRRVALKTIHLPDREFEDAAAAQEFFQRLQREAELGGSLLHPNIVTLYEAGYENDRISYLAMELVEGETLLGLMMSYRPAPVPVDMTLRVAGDVLRGLSHAHSKGITHRDIKPANILIAGDGTAKIADFGIARPDRSTMTAAGSLVGTPNYMSPEQVTNAALTPRADLFSLGVVLYEMLTATKAFAAPDITGILHNVLRHEPAHVSDLQPSVPRQVGDFVAALMRKNADERPSAGEALSAIPSLTPKEEPQPLPRRIAPRLAAAVIGVVALLVAIPIYIISSRVDSTPTVTIPDHHLVEFAEKRRALETADALLNAGKFEESLVAYEEYLAKYPHSTAAEEGRDRAAAAIAAQEKNTPAKPRTRRKQDEDISPRELLNRLKGVFKR